MRRAAFRRHLLGRLLLRFRRGVPPTFVGQVPQKVRYGPKLSGAGAA